MVCTGNLSFTPTPPPQATLVRSVDDLVSAPNTAVNVVVVCWLLVPTVTDEAQMSGIILSTAAMQRDYSVWQMCTNILLLNLS